MSILTTVADCGARLSGVILVSSNEYRMSRMWCRMISQVSLKPAMIWMAARSWLRHAAVNTRQFDGLALACRAGGGRGERGEPAADADRGGAAARQPGGGPLAVVHDGRGVLPGRGQGPGEVRDAALPPGRRTAGHRGGGGARLFARGVLSCAGVLFADGHGGAAGGAARPPPGGAAAPRGWRGHS